MIYFGKDHLERYPIDDYFFVTRFVRFLSSLFAFDASNGGDAQVQISLKFAFKYALFMKRVLFLPYKSRRIRVKSSYNFILNPFTALTICGVFYCGTLVQLLASCGEKKALWCVSWDNL